MSVVFGIASSENEMLDETLVQSMLDQARMNGQRNIQIEKFTNCILGYADFYPETRFLTKANRLFMIGGECFGKKDLIEKLKDNDLYKIKDNNTEFLSTLILKYGPENLASLDGHFLIFSYNKYSHELEIINDQLGLHPLFIVKCRNHIVFSSEYQILISLPFEKKEINYSAIKNYFLYGITLNGETLLKGLNNLEKGSVFKWKTNNDFTVKKYAQWEYRIDESISMEDALDEVYFLMQKRMMEKIEDGKLETIPITGGIDTRSMFNLIPQDLRKKQLWQTNLSPFLSESSDKDVIIAKMITEKYGLKHQINIMPLNRQEQIGTFKQAFESVRPARDWYNINGHFPNYFRDMFRNPNKLEKSIELTCSRFLNSPMGDCKSLSDRLISGCENENLVYFEYFQNKLRAFFDDHPIDSGKWINPVVFFLQSLRSPFTDASVYKIMLKLPRSYVKDGLFYLKLIERNNPELLDIPFVQNHFKQLNDPIINKIKELDYGYEHQHIRCPVWRNIFKRALVSTTTYNRHIFNLKCFFTLWFKMTLEYSLPQKITTPITSHWRYRDKVDFWIEHHFLKIESFLRSYYD